MKRLDVRGKQPNSMNDADDWAKEECACGHRRHAHQNGSGTCRHSRLIREAPADLPEPEYAPDQFAADPFAAPVNWPPYEEWPMREVACCPSFSYPEQDEP